MKKEELLEILEDYTTPAFNAIHRDRYKNVVDDTLKAMSDSTPNFEVAFNELAACVKYGMTVENTRKQLDEILIKHRLA
jgi:hypothetical protein